MSFRIPKVVVDDCLKESTPHGWVKAYLSLGSNLGDKKALLGSAIEGLKTSSGIKVIKVSSFYSSKAVDHNSDQPFINCAVEIETSLEPLELLDSLEQLEIILGRNNKNLNQPRTLDIDIVFYGEMVVSFPTLKVPHPKMAERRFVLEPLAEIASDMVHPTLKQTPANLALKVSNQIVTREEIESAKV